jgi:hypothetical protein
MLPPYYVYGILGVLLENTSGHGVSHLSYILTTAHKKGQDNLTFSA